ncbi:MAG TPA: histidine kinase [Roseiflexaceae bacterium]|nr:histidine kinase [Roseiflexaceae bacterium]
MDQQHIPKKGVPWQRVLAWCVGLIGVLNILFIHLFSLERVRDSLWIVSVPLSCGCLVLVTLHTVVRETITRRQIAWLCVSAAWFLLFCKFTFRAVIRDNDTFIIAGVFLFTLLGLAIFFPKSVWSLGTISRVICDSAVLAFSVIAILQSSVYARFGDTASAQAAAAYAVWVGFEIAGLITTIFLWYRHKQRVLGLLVLAALCIVLADVIGMVRQWYPGIYRVSGLPDISLNHLETMIIMLFAYYSVEHFKDFPSPDYAIVSRFEWWYRTGVPRVMLLASLAITLFVHPPERWVTLTLFAVATVQMIVSIAEEYRLVARLFRVRSDLTTANTRLVAAQAQLQQALLSAEDLAVEHERTRVAAEIHDGLGGHLSALKVHLQVAARVVEHDPPAAARSFASAQEEAASAQRELRRAIEALTAEHELHPLDVQLAELAQTSQRTGIRTLLTIHGDIQPLPLPVHHALHRVAQEALNNARRHAQATAVTIGLDFRTAGLVELRIADNGIGLPTGAPKTGSHGLRNMANRIEPLGGTISIANQPDQEGVLVWARVPLSTPASG